MKQRYLFSPIAADLKEKMVFIGGPRQVGKTTLAQRIGAHSYPSAQYLNWDTPEHRATIRSGRFDASAKLLILDEIHKYRRWKNHIKGIYDVYKDRWHILVTGSARLDLYRRSGDSLMGRYHYYRLHPFSLAELHRPQRGTPEPFRELSFPRSSKETTDILTSLVRFGGFPEPFLKQDEKTLRRWHLERVDRVIREDIRDIEQVRDLSALQVLVDLLPAKVGSLFSLNALREDLEVTHKTVAHWVDVLERFYVHFRIYPYSARAVRSLRREPKLYLWDWSPIAESGAKFENLVASHLLKFVHFLQDAEGYRAELFHLRDRAGREVDFLVTVNRKPWFAVEVKETNKEPAKTLTYFGDRLTIPFLYQVVGTPGVDILTPRNIRVMSAGQFLSGLV